MNSIAVSGLDGIESRRIGSYPIVADAPLEYRYALDAAMSVLAGKKSPLVICNVPQLANEVLQRVPDWGQERMTDAAIWVEPLVKSWRNDLRILGEAIPQNGRLAVVASRPLAKTLPERRLWESRPLGATPGGLWRLRRQFGRIGVSLDATYGVHTMLAIGLSLLSRQAERLGRPDLADRLSFAARLRYCSSGPLAAFSTVALLFARKVV